MEINRRVEEKRHKTHSLFITHKVDEVQRPSES